MPLSSQAHAFLNSLSRTPGLRFEGLPRIGGMGEHEVEAMLLELAEHGLVRIDGPPNQNSDLGKDVDSIELTNLGYMTAD